MSCPPQPSPGPEEFDCSDYGSDFTPDEEELLNELFAKAIAEHASQTPPAPTTLESTYTTPAAELADLQPAVLEELVADIEDGVEDLPAVRLPRVLGREKRPPWRHSSQQTQRSGPAPGWSTVAGRACQGAGIGDASFGMACYFEMCALFDLS